MLNPFEHKSLAELLDIILTGNNESDEAMWYVLHERMSEGLRTKYHDYEYQLWDSYEDLVDDFFLYLRECPRGRKHEPYSVLRTINNKEVFESWLLSTWRNYLSNRMDNDGVQKNGVGEIDEITLATITDNKSIADERKIEIVSQLIAYCLQVFLPRGRFIFLRSLLTILNKENALSTKDMAEALGMTEINYRVVNHRMKANEQKFLRCILKGENLRLNEESQKVATQIYQSFDNLYSVLMRCYDDTLQTLKQRETIQSLRLSNIKADGTMLHEPECSAKVGIRAFWSKLVINLGLVW